MSFGLSIVMNLWGLLDHPSSRYRILEGMSQGLQSLWTNLCVDIFDVMQISGRERLCWHVREPLQEPDAGVLHHSAGHAPHNAAQLPGLQLQNDLWAAPTPSPRGRGYHPELPARMLVSSGVWLYMP